MAVVMVSERYVGLRRYRRTLRKAGCRCPALAARDSTRAWPRVSSFRVDLTLFKRGRCARPRATLFLISAIIAPLVLAFAPSGWGSPQASSRRSFRAARMALGGRTLYLHGAEHRAIAALEQRRLREPGTARPAHALLGALRHELRRRL